MVGIYKITNPSGGIYIGQSTDIEKRIYSYSKLYCKDQPRLHASFLKYGFNNHSIEVIVNCSIRELNFFEIKMIKKFNSFNSIKGMNLTSGGQKYFKHSKEVRLKMSKAQQGNTKTLGRKQTIEEIQKRVKKTTGKKRTQEQKDNISKSLTGRKFSEKHKQNLRIGLKGVNSKKVLNTETKEIYQSAKEASEKTGFKKGTLIAMLNGQNKNKTKLIYIS